MAHKWVYLFTEGTAQMRDLLGGKGAGISEMTRAGLPVSPGFTITTEACNAYYDNGHQFPTGMWEQAMEALARVEAQTGKGFGDATNPLLVSVRSGGRDSMPGMMDTVLNLGLNERTMQGVIAQTGNERFAYDAYRRFIQMFGKIVLDIDAEKFEHRLAAQKQAVGAKLDTALDAGHLKALVAEFKAVVLQETGHPFPDDPLDQLRLAIGAVFGSWMGRRAVAYRDNQRIPHNLGTAVNVQTMVFGNLGWDSGTGVAFTRNPLTGEHVLYGEYLQNAQGEDVVAGIRTPKPIAQLHEDMPEVFDQFQQYAEMLERHYKDMQDLEFTVERGKLFMLQTRSGKRSAAAAVRIAVEMVKEGLIDRDEALLRVETDQVDQLLHSFIDPDTRPGLTVIAKGLNAAPGAAVGKAVFDADRAEKLGRAGEKVILVRPETNPDDVHGLIHAQGVLTARGGATSHAAVVARGLGKPCVAGCEALHIDPDDRSFSVDGVVVREGDMLSIDGSTGEVFVGAAPLIEPKELSPDLQTLLGWADSAQRMQVWANADYPEDAAKARQFGAQGIGLCRTEHMFFQRERLPVVRQMILNANDAREHEEAEGAQRLATAELAGNLSADAREKAQERLDAAARVLEHTSEASLEFQDALVKLEEVQTKDFEGILRVMHGLPVVIRLLDPPMHEFLPHYDELLVAVTEARVRGESNAHTQEMEHLLKAVEEMRETNPMLGLRGCRLGIRFPHIYQMQVRAIVRATATVQAEGREVKPEIMIPLVGHINELRLLKELLLHEVETKQHELGLDQHIKFGTMIEVPRAALTADEIAEDAEFFSFGTNDLTQTTFAISRDDAEGKFLLEYVNRGILPKNPFQVLDRKGVGRLMKLALDAGRATRPSLEVGICGEHGGDPESIEYANSIGLDYVSCSPYRVPVARLAAAQSALAQRPARQTV